MRMHLLKELTGADLANCAGAAASAAGTWWSLLGDAAVQLLGVPLPVVLAAATGAFLARTYQVAQPILRAVAGSASWVVGACALAPLAAPIAEKYAGIALPAGALAGAAFAIALAGPFALQHGVSYARSKLGIPEPVAPAPPAQPNLPSDSKGTP
jgi:hypothetical protein